MKVTTVALFMVLLGAVAFAQEPVNHAVMQPVAQQSLVNQPAAYQPTVAGSQIPVAIPTVFIPLPTQRGNVQPSVVTHDLSQPPQPTIPPPWQPLATECGCARR